MEDLILDPGEIPLGPRPRRPRLRRLQAQRRRPPRTLLRVGSGVPLFLLLAYGLNWLAWLPGILEAPERLLLYPFWHVVWALARNATPAVAALVVTALLWGRRDVGDLLRRVVHGHAAPGYYVLAVLLPALAPLASLWLNPDGRTELLAGWPRWPALATVAWSLQIALGEEIGWRGFALPRLVPRLGHLGSSVVMGALWAAWYLPQFMVPGTNLYGESFWMFFVLIVFYDSTLYTWLYARTARGRRYGSLSAVILLRWAQGVWVEVLPTPADALSPTLVALILITGLAVLTMPAPLLRRAPPEPETVQPA